MRAHQHRRLSAAVAVAVCVPASLGLAAAAARAADDPTYTIDPHVTDPAILARVADIGDRRLGKGVVVARDTPNFIGNHIGLYAIARILDVWAEGRLTIEEVDAMTGPAIGRPKSATFRTLDITGLDVLVHVGRNLEGRVGVEQAEQCRITAPPPRRWPVQPGQQLGDGRRTQPGHAERGECGGVRGTGQFGVEQVWCDVGEQFGQLRQRHVEHQRAGWRDVNASGVG